MIVRSRDPVMMCEESNSRQYTLRVRRRQRKRNRSSHGTDLSMCPFSRRTVGCQIFGSSGVCVDVSVLPSGVTTAGGGDTTAEPNHRRSSSVLVRYVEYQSTSSTAGTCMRGAFSALYEGDQIAPYRARCKSTAHPSASRRLKSAHQIELSCASWCHVLHEGVR